jgi:hypothetical protein
MRMAQLRSDVCDMLVLYPTQSLVRQIGAWSVRHGECRVETTATRSPREIRAALDRADMVLVDATEDHVQAIDAFALALGSRGASKTAVYTERMHEGLEPFVRQQGILLLFGPLSGAQWEGFFARLMPAGRQRLPGKLAA